MISEENSQTSAPTTRVVIDRFNEAFNRHDADALATLLTDDTVFEDTSPAPDGQRIEGKAAVVAFWRVWFTHNPDSKFEAEDVIEVAIVLLCSGCITNYAMGSRGTCVAWMSSRFATAKWPRSSPT